MNSKNVSTFIADLILTILGAIVFVFSLKAGYEYYVSTTIGITAAFHLASMKWPKINHKPNLNLALSILRALTTILLVIGETWQGWGTSFFIGLFLFCSTVYHWTRRGLITFQIKNKAKARGNGKAAIQFVSAGCTLLEFTDPKSPGYIQVKRLAESSADQSVVATVEILSPGRILNGGKVHIWETGNGQILEVIASTDEDARWILTQISAKHGPMTPKPCKVVLEAPASQVTFEKLWVTQAKEVEVSVPLVSLEKTEKEEV